MTRFFYIQIACWKKPCWMEDGGKCWDNYAGGHTPKAETDKIHKIVEADDIADLDWSDSFLVEDRTDCGWLSPDGKWHGCDSHNHDQYAWLVLKSDVKTLERKGWVRVWNKTDWTCEKIPTDGQRHWLINHNYDFNDEKWGRL